MSSKVLQFFCASPCTQVNYQEDKKISLSSEIGMRLLAMTETNKITKLR